MIELLNFLKNESRTNKHFLKPSGRRVGI